MTGAYFTVKGTRYQLLQIEMLSFDEALELKRISGLPVGEIQAAFAQMDPAAILGLFVLSMKRANPAATELDLRSENLIDVVDTLEVVGEEDDARPPDPGQSPSVGKEASSEVLKAPPTKPGGLESRSGASTSAATQDPSSVTTLAAPGIPAGSVPSSAG